MRFLYFLVLVAIAFISVLLMGCAAREALAYKPHDVIFLEKP